MKYICVACEDGGCILEIDVKANSNPWSCPWDDKKVSWNEHTDDNAQPEKEK